MNRHIWLRRHWKMLVAGVLGVLVVGAILGRNSLLADHGAISQTGAEDWPLLATGPEIGGLNRPVHITHAGDGSGRIFVVEQDGTIRIIKDGTVQQTPFLDIADRLTSSASEQGLLSVAFPPDYSSKGYFYVYYTRAPASDGATVVARYALTDDPDVADPTSEEVLLTVDQPFTNHNGGQLAFGPDGYLYIGLGDGGSGGDPEDNGQNPNTLLGSILRIDVESGESPYGIPSDNPFVGMENHKAEIWSYGLRNPWRFSFDRQTGDLYIGDVGQGRVEEIDFQPASSDGGENYGWNIMEGDECYNAETCDTSGLTMPVKVYPRTDGNCSVTGGMVYRGTEFANMQGIYFYADYCSGRLWGLRQVDDAWDNQLLIDLPFSITTFGTDEAGNLYLADYSNGALVKLVDETLPPDTGRVDPAESSQFTLLDEEQASEMTLNIPEGAVQSTAILTYTELNTDAISATLTNTVPLRYFRLEAVSDETAQPILSFDRPFTLTVGYSGTSSTAITAFYLEDNTFIPCEGCIGEVDQVNRQVILVTDRLTAFVIARNIAAVERVFLPAMRRP